MYTCTFKRLKRFKINDNILKLTSELTGIHIFIMKHFSARVCCLSCSFLMYRNIIPNYIMIILIIDPQDLNVFYQNPVVVSVTVFILELSLPPGSSQISLYKKERQKKHQKIKPASSR